MDMILTVRPHNQEGQQTTSTTACILCRPERTVRLCQSNSPVHRSSHGRLVATLLELLQYFRSNIQRTVHLRAPDPAAQCSEARVSFYSHQCLAYPFMHYSNKYSFACYWLLRCSLKNFCVHICRWYCLFPNTNQTYTRQLCQSLQGIWIQYQEDSTLESRNRPVKPRSR